MASNAAARTRKNKSLPTRARTTLRRDVTATSPIADDQKRLQDASGLYEERQPRKPDASGGLRTLPSGQAPELQNILQALEYSAQSNAFLASSIRSLYRIPPLLLWIDPESIDATPKDRAEHLQRIIERVLKDTDPGDANAAKRKWLSWFFLYLMWWEGKRATARTQDRGGPGRGFPQIEPNTAMDGIKYILKDPKKIGVGMLNFRQQLPARLRDMAVRRRMLKLQFIILNKYFAQDNAEFLAEAYRPNVHDDLAAFERDLRKLIKEYPTIKRRISLHRYKGIMSFVATVADPPHWGSLMLVESVLPADGSGLVERPRMLLRRRYTNGLYDRYWHAITTMQRRSASSNI